MSDWAGIFWLVVLLCVNAFFVGAEFAVISARRSQIEPRAQTGSTAAKTALWAMENATLMMATCQLGITVCSLLILNVSEPAIHHLVEVPLGLTGISHELVSVIGFVITLLLVSYLHVVFGEMMPKNAAFSMPDRAVLLLAPPLVAISKAIRPVIYGMNAVANGVLWLFKVEPQSEANSTFTLEEVENIVANSTREGVLADSSGALAAAFEFTNKTARDLFVPATELVVLPATTTVLELEAAVQRDGFSRYVLADSAGALLGYVHIKDLLKTAESKLNEPIDRALVRPMLAVSAKTDLEDVLALLQNQGTHLARVHNETGKLLGVIFLEDVIEELVGEVNDVTIRHHGR
ncbi:hemolysin family protein [Canibacter sp. lx-45]|uniref:hemolysin family protein n=1 Tax=Canibacter zhuwentaonis TaxID=2837491 RepID=UPI001BDD2FA4|nr:hemolysin family protein [Canibacter zhuwentaonis]